MPNITIREIASFCNVSTATVSRALGEEGHLVKPATRDLVLSACEKLGYKTNRAARRLRTGQTYVIAYVLNRSDPSDRFARQLMLGLTDRLSKSDFHLVVIPEHEISPLGSIKYLAERQVCDGAVLTHTLTEDVRVSWLADQKLPFVTHGQTDGRQRHDFVDFDTDAFMKKAFEQFDSRALKRVGILLPPRYITFSRRLETAFLACLEQGGADSRLMGEIVSGITTESDQTELKNWAAQNVSRFDGLIVPNDAVLPALMAGMEETKLTVGTDCTIICKTLGMNSFHLPRGVISFHEDLYQSGYELGNVIIDRIRNPESPTREVLIPPVPQAIAKAI